MAQIKHIAIATQDADATAKFYTDTRTWSLATRPPSVSGLRAATWSGSRRCRRC